MAEIALPWAVRPATRPQAGGGHVSRCCALALALQEQGLVLAVVERDGDAGHLRFSRQGVPTVTADAAAQLTFAGVVLDDYDLGESDVAAWRQRVTGLVVQVDDFLKPLPGVDLIVNARLGLRGSSAQGVPALLGEEFSMLATPYCNRSPLRIAAGVGRVVVGIGMFDMSGTTERIIPVVAEVFGADCKIDVVLGGMSPNASAVADVAKRHTNCVLNFDEAEPWRFIEVADVAITGGGQSLLERLAIGVPTIGLAVADNQEQPLQCVADAGAALSVGTTGGDWIARLRAALVSLHDPGLRQSLSTAAQRLIDGCGAKRVADAIYEFQRSNRRYGVRG